MTEATKEYLAGLSGPGCPFNDRGRAADWCIREVKRRNLIRKPYDQLEPRPTLRGPPGQAHETRTTATMTLARDVCDWLDGLSGPYLAFKFRTEGIAWCLEQARLQGFKPKKGDILAEAATA